MSADQSNVLIVQIDGPNLVTGNLAIVTRTGTRTMRSAMLCRCGRSLDKPFCDGAHVKSGFRDGAQLPMRAESGAVGTGVLTVRPMPDGPNRCEGPLVMHGIDGPIACSSLTLLCRCGESRNKPYCDGTHRTIGFRS